MKITLTQSYEMEIDNEDYDKIKDYKWHTRKCKNTCYAITHIYKSNKRTTIAVHRLLINVPENMFVDHKDGNGLNNKKENLRICTNAQNQMNRNKPINNVSGFKGVYYINEKNRKRKYRAFICKNNKTINLGDYFTPEEAAITYDKKAKELFGEFALLNFLE